MKNNTPSGFTLPGESGYEALTLKLAEKWGADVIRDSDGTTLSKEILDAGYGIYSTICLIRGHNEWAEKNRDKLQQTFLITSPKVAAGDTLRFRLMDDFFREQFAVNESEASLRYWQVYDRTTEQEVAREQWSYDPQTQEVAVRGIRPWHKYTVSFLAYRIWEEISMYNHTTNHWDKEHLMPIDPRYPETQEYLLGWLKDWCGNHPATTVVRFTSMFYNFVWIWGSDERNRHLFTDWASYDFTVSPLALEEFQKKYGYALTAEDFVNQGKFHVTHMPGGAKKADWMEFINDFVLGFGKKLVDMVHSYGKKAYVFYDDSWVGIEPYNGRFREFGFDGMIKAVFSGFESRLCSGVPVETHELRLHPYLFPVGVDGSPSFLEEGDPKGEAQRYWKSVRRAILREPIERIGLGGYLHLVERKPDFVEYMAKLAEEFRRIREFHKNGKPMCLRPKVAVLHAWGALRSWTLSGHFHETSMHDLIQINESLSGLPFEVSFLSFQDVKNGALDQVDVVINAGYAGSAWSGGDAWKDERVTEALTEWVYGGGAFLGVGEPSAADGYDTYFRMAHVLGVDLDTGARVCHGKWKYTWKAQEIQDGRTLSEKRGEEQEEKGKKNGENEVPIEEKTKPAVEPVKLIPEGTHIRGKERLYLTDGKAEVWLEENGTPSLTFNQFGKGAGIYLSSYRHTEENTRLLMNLILAGAKEGLEQEGITDNLYTECAYYPESRAAVVINNTDKTQEGTVTIQGERLSFATGPYDTWVRTL